MTNPQNQAQQNNLSALEKCLNWIGDKLVDIRNNVEFDYGTQRLVNNLNVVENYKIIYEKLNSENSNGGWSIKIASGTGAVIQAYTGPTLDYTIGKLSQGLSQFYGEETIANGIDFFIGGNSNGSLNLAYARAGESAGNNTASGLSKLLSWGEERFTNTNSEKNSQSTLLSTPSNSQTPNTVNITKATNPSTNKSSVSVSSNDYTKEQLTESFKTLIQNDGSDLIGSSIKIQGSNGTLSASLLNGSLMSEAEKFLAKNTKLDAPILSTKDNDSNTLYLIKNNEDLNLSDGSKVDLNTILNTIDSAKAATDAFINQYMHQLTSIFTTGQGIAGLISDVNAAIQRGDAPEQIAKNIALKALVQTVGQEILNSFLLSDADKALFIANPQLAMSADASGHALLQNGVMSQNGQDALNNFANNHPVYNASYLMAVSMATSLLLNADKDWDSQEYTIAAAQATAQVSAQIAVAAAVKAGWLGNTMAANAAGAGVGAAAAYIINAGINDLFADDHMNSHQWQSTLVRAGVAGVAAYIISAGINDLFAKDHMNSHQWQSTLVRAGVAGVAAAYIINAGINDLFAKDHKKQFFNSNIIHLTKLIKNHIISIPSKLQQKTKNHFITIHNEVRFKDIANIIEIKPSLNSILNLNSSIFIANDNFLKVQDFIIKQEIRL